MTAKALPIILCGQSQNIARVVADNLLPEVKVIHTILSPSSGVSSLPAYLASSANSSSTNGEERPVAVVYGAAYTDTDVENMRDACEAKSKQGIYWLKADKSVSMPPPGPEYGLIMVGRVKSCLERLSQEGRLGKADMGEEVMF